MPIPYVHDWFGEVSPDWSKYDMEEAELSGITDKAISHIFSKLESGQDLTINLNSPGGYADQGVAIMNIVRANSAIIRKTYPDFRSTVNIVGTAYSAAAVLTQGFDVITMAVGTDFMIHRASTMGWGTASDLRDVASHLDKVDLRICEIFSQHMKLSSSAVLKLLEVETYYNPTEALSAGLITGLTFDPVNLSKEAQPNSAHPTRSRNSAPQFQLVNRAIPSFGAEWHKARLQVNLNPADQAEVTSTETTPETQTPSASPAALNRLRTQLVQMQLLNKS